MVLLNSDLNKCFICGINQNDLPNGKLYKYRECNNCKIKHDEFCLYHNIISLYYISNPEEQMGKDGIFTEIPDIKNVLYVE